MTVKEKVEIELSEEDVKLAIANHLKEQGYYVETPKVDIAIVGSIKAIGDRYTVVPEEEAEDIRMYCQQCCDKNLWIYTAVIAVKK